MHRCLEHNTTYGTLQDEESPAVKKTYSADLKVESTSLVKYY